MNEQRSFPTLTLTISDFGLFLAMAIMAAFPILPQSLTIFGEAARQSFTMPCISDSGMLPVVSIFFIAPTPP